MRSSHMKLQIVLLPPGLDDFSEGRPSGEVLRSSERLEQADEPSLCGAIGVDVRLRMLQASVTGQHLDISDGAARARYALCRQSDEGSSPRVRGTTVQTQLGVEASKPVHDTAGRHSLSPL